MSDPKQDRGQEEARSGRAADRGLGLFIAVALGSAVLILVAAGVWFWRGYVASTG